MQMKAPIDFTDFRQRTGARTLPPSSLRLGCLLLCLLLPGGCQPGASNNKSADQPAKVAKSDNPRDMMLALIKRYRSCASYADNSALVLEYKQDSKSYSEQTKFSVRFKRPGMIQLLVHREEDQVLVQSDGNRLQARLLDQATKNFAGQVAERPAPPQLRVADIYAITEYSDPSQPAHMTSVLLGLPVHLDYGQLGLLLSDVPIETVLPTDARVEALSTTKYRGQDCNRVAVTNSENRQTFVFWIDDALNLLKIEYPTDSLFGHIDETERPQEVRLYAEFQDVQVDGEISVELFKLESNANDRLVRYWVLPPVPLPHKSLGKQIPAFELTDLDGVTKNSREFVNQFTVLVWFDRHESSKFVLEQLKQLQSRHGNRVNLQFVCAESPQDFDNKTLRRFLASNRITTSVFRDLTAAGRDRFDIQSAPTILILGPDHGLHFFEVGANPNIADGIDLVLTGLTSGTNVGGDVLKQFEVEMAAFQRQMAAATAITNKPTDELKPFRGTVVAAKHLAIEELWNSSDLTLPGNLQVVREGDNLSIYVINELKEVAKLDADGKITRRFPLQLDENDVVSFLKASQDRHQTFFLAGTRHGPQILVFDQNFKRVLSYPPISENRVSVNDATVADIDRNGKYEVYVAFADSGGLHRIDMDGNRVWKCSSVIGPSSVIVDRANLGQFLACDESGRVTPIFVNGQSRKQIAVGQRTIHQLVPTINKRTRPSEYLGMSYTIEGRLIAIGLNRQLEEQWSYGLPNGVYASPVETPISAHLFSDQMAHWIMVGPDGSIHVVSDDSEFFDSFNLGKRIDGIGAYMTRENEGVLVVTSEKSVSAFRVTLKK